MVKFMSQAKMIFRKLNSPNTPQVQSIASGQYFFQLVEMIFFLYFLKDLFFELYCQRFNLFIISM
jgi:hypothetical protein